MRRSLVTFVSRLRTRSHVYRVNHSRQMSGPVSVSILEALPAPSTTDSCWPQLKDAVSIDPRRLIVLDDDPTGCQTVYDCNVLLDYSVERICEQLKKDDKLFYILTNTRSMNETEAIQVTKDTVQNVQRAVELCSYRQHIQFISRSDSTLRGHYPAEVKAITDSLQSAVGGTILVPAFFEGGRWVPLSLSNSYSYSYSYNTFTHVT